MMTELLRRPNDIRRSIEVERIEQVGCTFNTHDSSHRCVSLIFQTIFCDSHHSSTDPKRKARKSSHPIPSHSRFLNKFIALQGTTNLSSSSHPHPPPSSPWTMSNVSLKTPRTSPFPSPPHSHLISPKPNTKNTAANPHKKPAPALPSKATSNPTDLIAIYYKRTTIDSSRKETVMRLTYFVEALSKFGTDTWKRVVCMMTMGQAW